MTCMESRNGIIFLAFLAQLGTAISANFMYPIVPFVVKHFGYADTNIGLYSGLISGSLHAGKFVGTILWTYVSPRLQYKICVTIGLSCMSIWVFLFGVSPNVIVSALLAFLIGASDSVTINARTTVHKLSDTKYQGFGMNVIYSAWGLGTLCGAGLSTGLLQHSSSSAATFTEIYPLFIGTCVMSGLILCILVIFVVLNPNGETSERIRRTVMNLPPPVRRLTEDDSVHGTLVSNSVVSYTPEFNRDDPGEAMSFLDVVRFLCGQYESRLIIIMGALHNMVMLAAYEMLVLFAQTPTYLGGVELTPQLIGLCLMPALLVISVVQVVVNPRLQKCLGLIRLNMYINLFTLIALTCLPMSNLAESLVGRILAALPCGALIRFGNISGYGCHLMLLLNTCPKSMTIQVTGLNLLIACLANAIGAYSAGAIFAWSVSHSFLYYPTNISFAFQIAGILYLLCSSILCLLPHRVNEVME